MKIIVGGSMGFYKEMERVRNELVKMGHEVKLPTLQDGVPNELGGGERIHFNDYIEKHGGIDAFPSGHVIWNVKEKAIKEHNEKIEWADAIVIVNLEKNGVTGFVGGGVMIDISIAFYLHKKIFILNPISSKISAKEEIMGMQAIILDGDLCLVK